SSAAGRTDLPLPRGSKVSTRVRRAKSGICAFQQREWMMDQVGRKRIAGSPSPQDSQCTRTPPRSTNPAPSRARARACSRLATPALALANAPARALALALPIWPSPLEGLDPSIDPGQQGLVPLADPGKALEHVPERKGHRQCRHRLHRQLVLHSVLADGPG